MSITAQQKAHAVYETKRTIKRVSFNNDSEAVLLEKLESIQAQTSLSFSEWVKKQIEIAQ